MNFEVQRPTPGIFMSLEKSRQVKLYLKECSQFYIDGPILSLDFWTGLEHEQAS